KDALRRLEQVLEAVKAEAEGGPKQANDQQAGGGEGGEGGEQGGGPEPNGLPSPAQLKLLRAMHPDALEESKEFKRKHPDLTKLNDKEQAELQAIRRQEQDVKELFEELRRPAGEPAPEGGDKK